MTSKKALSSMTVLFVAAAVTIIGNAREEETIEVPFMQGRGLAGYEQYCASCHGRWADGTDKGPPLIHAYYRPDHHSDFAFYRAISEGTHQHHWNFGPMEPVAGVDRKEAEQIVGFVRWLQQYKGLY